MCICITMKYILWILILLLPLHAFMVTVLKCKFWVNTDMLRFWKEGVIVGLILFVFVRTLIGYKYSLKNIYHKNTLLGLTTAFIICSAVYIIFPFFELKTASLLGFRYDTFFLLALIIGLYSGLTRELHFFLKILFFSTFGILIVFLPWYVFGDISLLSEMFWYSSNVSTYTANECISFAQNVNGQHRFQGTFGGPIRFSVFLTLIGSLFMGWLLSNTQYSKKQHISLWLWAMTLILPSIFFSFSKTSMLGALFTAGVFIFLSYKYIYRKKITQKFYILLGVVTTLPLLFISLFHWELFLHMGAMLNRLENLKTSLEMFFYNPIGYGLGIAGPASQIGSSIESAGSWQIAANSVLQIHKFLPENWYVQILLEQGIIGCSLFLSLIWLIWYRLVMRVKKHRDYLSVWVTAAYFWICFMALFTHAFEEAASSYILFFLIWLLLAESITQEKLQKRK